MSNFDRDPVSVASRQVHGPSFGMGTLGLVALLGLGAGTILGGVIMPFLRSTPPDQSQSAKLEAAQETSRALLFSMYPQTIYAPVIDGAEPVSTGMSVEQYLTELEVRSSQAGLVATKAVERKGDLVEISYAFADNEAQNARTFPQSKTKMSHPKTLVLTFVSGPLPGTIALAKARVDGRDRGAGASFVDFVSLGAMPPQLGEGQFLTARGIFEIKLTGTGVGAFLDGVLVYPAAPPKPGPILALPGTKAETPTLPNVLPRRLALQSFQPAVGPLKDRLILVASTTATDNCSARAIIIDAKRGTVIELPEPLIQPAVAVSNAKDALIFNGFCVVQPPSPTPSPDAPAKILPAPPEPKVEVRLSARYDLKTGTLTWQRETVAIPIAPPISATDAGVQTGAATPWRQQSETRLASPVISGGAMVSVACRPGGGVTIALAGMPAPSDGQAAGMRFVTGGTSALAQMRWRASVNGYELDGAGRPNEARAILDRLRTGGTMTISGAGASKQIGAPGQAQINQLVAKCGTAPSAAPLAAAAGVVATAAAIKPKPPAAKPKTVTPPVATPKATPPKPKPMVAARPVPRPPVAKAAETPRPATPRPSPAPTPKPKPKPPEPKAVSKPEPRAEVKPKPVSEAAPAQND
jgi:hypothetical protein